MKKNLQKFHLVRVVTKDIVTDSFQGVRNIFGLRLRGYERMLNKAISDMINEMDLKYEVKWHRLIINPLQKGSAMIILYGEGVAK